MIWTMLVDETTSKEEERVSTMPFNIEFDNIEKFWQK